MSKKKVSERDLYTCLVKLRDLRRWAVLSKIDPWAFRQMLLIALEMDTRTALARGISLTHLVEFDSEAKKDVRSWMMQERRRLKEIVKEIEEELKSG